MSGGATQMTSASALIVDGSLTVRMALVDALQEAGLKAYACATLDEARTLLAAHAVTGVIVDCDATEESPMAIVRLLHSWQPEVLVLLSAGHKDVGSVLGVEAVKRPYDSQEIEKRLVAEAQARAESKSQRILIIDDSQTFRESLAEALEARGYRVIKAASGEEGLRLAAQHYPHAFVVDGVLPGIDGPTLIRRLRLDAAFRSVPCILLTAAQEREAELLALDSGADAFVRKDEDLDLLLAKITVTLRSAGFVPAETSSLHAKKRILAVDDSATYRAELTDSLTGEGYEVLAAASGEEALAVLRQENIDCVLLDLVMPGLSGNQTCRRIKEDRVLRDIPVLLLTAVEDRQTMLEGLAVGADDYIQKSSEFEVLKARLRAQMRRRQFEEEARRIREQLLRREIDEAEARAARAQAEARAAMVRALEEKNAQLEQAYRDLQAAQSRLVQAAKMASLGELVAGVAHEINNPLAFAISHLNTAIAKLNQCENEGMVLPDRATPHWDKAKNRLVEMQTGLERIRELVIKLRRFSRLDEGERKYASIRECVESTLMILKHRFGEKIAVNAEYAEVDIIDCYPGLLNQALMNLLSNAIDSIPGEGAIHISTAVDEKSFVISIEDTGIGISMEVRDRVFEPFFTTKPPGQGTGLGLSITYSIVQKHGGELLLTPRDDGGTRAVMRIPLAL